MAPDAVHLTVADDRLAFATGLAVSFHRTLRVPDDGREYPLPAGLGAFHLHRVSDFAGRLPAAWAPDACFLAMYPQEALWIGFESRGDLPHAVKVHAGGINVVSGEPARAGLHGAPQDYLVAPDQPWIDGINAGSAIVRQFVAMPLGRGATIEGQLTGIEVRGGLQLEIFPPKPERLDDIEARRRALSRRARVVTSAMGMGAGGRIRQRIHPDAYGIEVWDERRRTAAEVYLLNVDQYEAATGRRPPPTPITADAYAAAGIPWFALADEARGDLAPADPLTRIRSVDELEQEVKSRDDGPSAPEVKADNSH